MKVIKPDYNNCLTNLSNSILKHFGIKSYHESLKELDKLLEEEYENVVLLIYDGLGSKIIDKCLANDSILKANKIKDITSVFPPTTTSATTSILSAKNPVEHGYLGWNMYFKDINKTISLFTNEDKTTKEEFKEYNVSDKKLKYKSIIEQINKETEANAYGLFPFGVAGYDTRKNLYKQIINFTKIKGKKFIYAYVEEPDHTLHDKGINNTHSKDLITEIEEEVKELSENIDNTLLIITADHGHIESTPIILEEYKDLYNMLERTTSIEPRAVSFKVKDNNKEEFKTLFNNYFKDDFLLYTKKEIIDEKLFGTGKENKYFEDALGDYLALAIKDKYINFDKNDKVFKSHHAGLTEDEVLVPLIAIRKKEDLEKGIIREVSYKDFSKIKGLANEFQRLKYINRKDIFASASTYTQTELFELSQRKDDRLCLVYELNGEIIGLIEIKIYHTDGDRFRNHRIILSIEKLVVKKEFRRQKIATKLYQEVLNNYRRRKIDRIEVNIFNFSKEAIKFVESLGMTTLSSTYELKL